MSTWSLPSSADAKHKCDNCGEIWKADELEGIENLDNRVDPDPSSLPVSARSAGHCAIRSNRTLPNS